MLEKELIFEQSSRLAARLQTKANAGKEDTLELAKKVTLTDDVLYDLSYE